MDLGGLYEKRSAYTSLLKSLIISGGPIKDICGCVTVCDGYTIEVEQFLISASANEMPLI